MLLLRVHDIDLPGCVTVLLVAWTISPSAVYCLRLPVRCGWANELEMVSLVGYYTALQLRGIVTYIAHSTS